MDLLKVSSLYLTSPVGDYPQNDFVNCAVLVRYIGGPRDLLSQIKIIEKQMGRTITVKWGPRIIDIDILLFENVVLNEEDLKIPHPELHKRKFAIIPLLELNRNLTHPIFGKRLREFLPQIERSQKVRFLSRISLKDLDIDKTLLSK